MIIGIIASQITAVAHTYAITSGYIRGGQANSNYNISYIIKHGTTTLKSGSIRFVAGQIALTSTEITSFNSAMGTDGGTFTIIDSTKADMSYVTLSLTFSTDGAGATTKSASGSYDTMDGYAINGSLIIP